MTQTATRDAFGQALVNLGEKHKHIVVLDADLSESTRSAKFGHKYPDRFFQMGIQEANMLGTAAGLASTGKVAFCCSFACFITGRFDQIKVSVAYNNANVVIVGTHAGVGVGPDGYTQMSLEDIGLMRTLPNMLVLQPADDIETEQMMTYLVETHRGPSFLRLTRQKLQRVHDESYRFEVGKADRLRLGKDLMIVATGGTVQGAVAAADRLNKEGKSVGVVNIPCIQPLQTDSLLSALGDAKKILTVEDHSINTGLGSAICELLAESSPRLVHRVGLRDFGESGAPDALYAKFHLDADGIYSEALAQLK